MQYIRKHDMIAYMALPKAIKTAPRSVAITVRLSEKTVSNLKALAKANGLSQADVIEFLIQHEFNESKEVKKSKTTR